MYCGVVLRFYQIYQKIDKIKSLDKSFETLPGKLLLIEMYTFFKSFH